MFERETCLKTPCLSSHHRYPSPLCHPTVESSRRRFAVEPRELLLGVPRLWVDGLPVVRVLQIPLAADRLPTLTLELDRHRVALVIQRGHPHPPLDRLASLAPHRSFEHETHLVPVRGGQARRGCEPTRFCRPLEQHVEPTRDAVHGTGASHLKLQVHVQRLQLVRPERGPVPRERRRLTRQQLRFKRVHDALPEIGPNRLSSQRRQVDAVEILGAPEVRLIFNLPPQRLVRERRAVHAPAPREHLTPQRQIRPAGTEIGRPARSPARRPAFVLLPSHEPVPRQQVALDHPLVVQQRAHRLRHQHVHLLGYLHLLDLPVDDHDGIPQARVPRQQFSAVLRHGARLNRVHPPRTGHRREERQYPRPGADVHDHLILKVARVFEYGGEVRPRAHRVLEHVLLLGYQPVVAKVLARARAVRLGVERVRLGGGRVGVLSPIGPGALRWFWNRRGGVGG
mmetsp:Transcript_4895/g.18336  ORF Transcript_4895/g.18336 Transcript_4895/m.18336 type:complete len:454 (+) Transcript_4895:8-1369(+)